MTIKKKETKETGTQRKTFGEFSDDRKRLREFIEQWCLGREPARKEYATAPALWTVPDSSPLSQDDAFDLFDFGGNPVKAGTLAREIRKLRKRIQRPDRAFTDFTEEWVASQLDILGARNRPSRSQCKEAYVEPMVLLHVDILNVQDAMILKNSSLTIL